MHLTGPRPAAPKDQLGGALLPIPFWGLFQTILLTVVAPLALGMWLRRYLGPALETAREIAPAIAAIAIIIICSYAVAANHERIADVGLYLFLIVVIINLLGYLAGWYLARLYGFDKKLQIALSIEIGMQNAGLGVALVSAGPQPGEARRGSGVWGLCPQETQAPA